jgi:hypothetical protein
VFADLPSHLQCLGEDADDVLHDLSLLHGRSVSAPRGGVGGVRSAACVVEHRNSGARCGALRV